MCGGAPLKSSSLSALNYEGSVIICVCVLVLVLDCIFAYIGESRSLTLMLSSSCG